MFTTKYISFQLSPLQSSDETDPRFYDRCETIDGPWSYISQSYDDETRGMVVHAHREGGAPGCTWGPVPHEDRAPGTQPAPRPTLYVMNESGATVAKYDF
jgi:hypothetical protein